MCVSALNNKVADRRDKSEADPEESSGDRDLDRWLFGNFSGQQTSPPQPVQFPSLPVPQIDREREMSAMVSALTRVVSGESAPVDRADTREMGRDGGSSSGSGVGRKRAHEDDDDQLGGVSVHGGEGQEALREAPGGDFPRGGLSSLASQRGILHDLVITVRSILWLVLLHFNPNNMYQSFLY
ncbi:hypothetical protein CRG98_021259 [Punica granatum]|uniref:Uncharacterized protein n=1 Tax=Punica granatum TaxID=22663 RepID=A0A2I0JPZ4_PUNGR|nr:hypothetical protein CRG98_021259 [Punica granatum]